MASKETKEIFTRIRRRADALERLEDSLVNPPPGQLRDTINRVAVEGRSLTNILQNLRSEILDFDAWYQPKVEEMRNDNLMTFFYRLRTDSLKKGVDGIAGGRMRMQPRGRVSATADGIIVEWLQPDGSRLARHYPTPEGTVGKFLGDSEGGCGFFVKTPNGKTVKRYVSIPPEVADVGVTFDNPPTEHRGQKLKDTSPVALSVKYIRYLQELVDDAEHVFIPPERV